jgi:biotin carboxyl carrier protein
MAIGDQDCVQVMRQRDEAVRLHSYRVQMNGTTYNVTLEPKNRDKFRVKVNDRIFESEPMTEGEISTYVVRSGDEIVRAQTTALQSDTLDVWIEGVPFSASVQSALADSATISLQKGRKERTETQIRALMPGRVTNILVKDGDSIELGAPLIILEAMKMQNEITSPLPGRVKKVYVKEGETVRKDSVMIVLE